MALGLLALFPASDLAVALVNRAVTALIKPRVLPRLELRDGVPASLRTIVVMPTMLTKTEDIEQQVDQLEIHYLANPDGDLYFALLSDWTDAAVESVPDDEELVACAADAIGRLNRQHGEAPGGGERFLFLHRRRIWNEGEGKWMGWERKRGKLHELNRLLRGATDTTFVALAGTIPKKGSLRHHPRRRHAAAARSGLSLDRHHGSSTQPSIPRSSHTARHRRLCHPATARDPDVADRSGRLALPAHLLRACRDRPVRGCRVGRVPGSLP